MFVQEKQTAVSFPRFYPEQEDFGYEIPSLS
jgi:hypothetical protein